MPSTPSRRHLVRRAAGLLLAGTLLTSCAQETSAALPVQSVSARPSATTAPTVSAANPPVTGATPELPAGWKTGPTVHLGRLAPISEDATQAYIDAIDVERYERNGTDYTAPAHDPARLGRPLLELDRVFDYDTEQLAEIELRLAGVDRHRALRALFDAVTAGAADPQAEHEAVVGFLQRAMLHSTWLQPMYADGSAVYDPLVLLELGEGRCGQTNRIAADLMEAGGYRTRMVQFSAHISAEVFYDGDWHALEADLLSGGVVPRDPDGSIPSFAELSEHPAEFDSLNFLPEPNMGWPTAQPSIWTPGDDPIVRYTYPSYYLVSSRGDTPPSYLVKTATREQEAASRWFGWEYYTSEPDTDRTMHDVGPREYVVDRAPLEVQRDGATVTLTFAPADDVVERVVSVGTESRQWSALADPLGMARGQVAYDWTPDRYDEAFEPLPADVGTWTTPTPELTFTLPVGVADRPVYISYVARDAYAVEIAKFNLTPSIELRLDP